MKKAIVALVKAVGQILMETDVEDRTTNNLIVAITDWLRVHSN